MRFFEAAERGDEAMLRGLVAEDVTMTWPQSGERFRGRDNALAALSVQDDVPTPAGEPTIRGSGDVWVVTLPLRYATGLVHYVGIFELREGLISASTEYFAEPFEPKAARARYREA